MLLNLQIEPLLQLLHQLHLVLDKRVLRQLLKMHDLFLFLLWGRGVDDHCLTQPASLNFIQLAVHRAYREALLALSGSLALPPLDLFYLGYSHKAKKLFVMAFELLILVSELTQLF